MTVALATVLLCLAVYSLGTDVICSTDRPLLEVTYVLPPCFRSCMGDRKCGSAMFCQPHRKSHTWFRHLGYVGDDKIQWEGLRTLYTEGRKETEIEAKVTGSSLDA